MDIFLVQDYLRTYVSVEESEGGRGCVCEWQVVQHCCCVMAGFSTLLLRLNQTHFAVIPTTALFAEQPASKQAEGRAHLQLLLYCWRCAVADAASAIPG